MWLSDPSEAVESSDIVPSIHSLFEVLEQKGFGGAILHLLFSGIAHHFVTPDVETRRLHEFAFSIEDTLLRLKEIEHDFALVNAGKWK
jgi:hypothetical protein